VPMFRNKHKKGCMRDGAIEFSTTKNVVNTGTVLIASGYVA
jgi:hypothetical protein